MANTKTSIKETSTRKPARPPGALPPRAAGAKKPSLPPGANGAKKPSLPPGAAGARKPSLPPGAAGAKKPSLPPGAAGARNPSLPPGAKLPPGTGNGSSRPKPSKSKVEIIKESSRNLRGSLAEDVRRESDHFEEAGRQVLKFHGIYQQDDRDNRKGGKDYSFMVRTRIPGGHVTPEQYIVHDELADAYGDGTIRITTRQDFQLHGVVKGDLQESLRAINESLLTTLSACGDIARNVMCTPVPATKPYHLEIEQTAFAVAGHLFPKTRAYHEVWLNGDKVFSGEDTSEDEPLYGKAYLPRKFKVGVAFPGDNSIDVYTQDVGLIAIVEDESLSGFNVLVGGGLGMTHNKPGTYPRLADALAFVETGRVVDVVEKIVLIQRDHGDRQDRRHARLKYLIDDWGLDRFRSTLEERLGYKLAPPADSPPMSLELYLGWNRQGDGRWYLGVSVENGRIKGDLKSGLRAVVERFRPGIRLTPNHDILFTDIDEGDRDAIDRLLADHGVPQHLALSNARKYSMACPALPTCGLAITEAERVLPEVIDQFEIELGRLGLQDEVLSIRMTGCPNGCARPYVADIGFVGRSLNQYTVFLGGRSDGTRLNKPYADLVPLDGLVPVVTPILQAFREERVGRETFGDYCARIGILELQKTAERYVEYAQAS